MRVLVVGSGGREHALAWAIRRSPRCDALHAAPGNPGLATLAECHAVGTDDLDGLVALARSIEVGLVVVGPEAPLVAGLADRLAAARIPCFGPGAAGARLEGSKAFAKDLMRELRIPTARYGVFTDAPSARASLSGRRFPVVVKADGLAAGKGVVVAPDADAAARAIDACIEEGAFGEAGRRIVIEDFLPGRECSLMALTDGEALLFLPPSRDHKRIGDGDTGPNTGGMGAFSPVPDVDDALQARVASEVFVPMLHGLQRRGIPFHGVLYAGLMLSASGPTVLEWNVRFGDPETQAVLPRFQGDLLVALHAAATGDLARVQQLAPGPPAVCVVAAAAGYPATPRTGDPITGVEAAGAEPGVAVFHAGTALRDGRLVTSGGRVLGVMAQAESARAARERAYAAMAQIEFAGQTIRRDIGASA